jgi:hypothetical protein
MQYIAWDTSCAFTCICTSWACCGLQALRASLLKKYARVRQLLDYMHTKRMSNYEKVGSHRSLRSAAEVEEAPESNCF